MSLRMGALLQPGGAHSNRWGSVYATHFLVEARKAGYALTVYKNAFPTCTLTKGATTISNPCNAGFMPCMS